MQTHLSYLEKCSDKNYRVEKKLEHLDVIHNYYCSLTSRVLDNSNLSVQYDTDHTLRKLMNSDYIALKSIGVAVTMKHLQIILFVVIFYTFQHPVVTLKCYYCSNDGCANPDTIEEAECPPSSEDILCISLTEGNSTLKTCGRKSENIVKECNAVNDKPDSVCYTCDTDLCNGKRNQGVTKCYTCSRDCENPLPQECSNSSEESYLCRSSTVTINGLVSYQLGCALATVSTIELCTAVDKTDIASCYTCDQDLCNDGLPPVTQCYSCHGECSHLLDVEQCPSTLGVQYMCMASKRVSGNDTMETRGCYPISDDIVDACVEFNGSLGSCNVCYRELCNGL